MFSETTTEGGEGASTEEVEGRKGKSKNRNVYNKLCPIPKQPFHNLRSS